jgi:hypothetical protein
MLGSEREATEAAVRLLRIRGRVIPMTWDHAHLRAELEDGSRIEHEAGFAEPARDPKVSIRRVFLAPRARANPDALEAIRESDFVVLAPGDLYSSTIRISSSRASRGARNCAGGLVYVQNLMTRRGETHGYSASRHVAEIARYAGRVPDAVLVHRGAISAELVRRYAAEEAHPIELDLPALRAQGVRVVHEADLLSDTALVRHDPARTADALARVFARLSAPRNLGPRRPDTSRPTRSGRSRASRARALAISEREGPAELSASARDAPARCCAARAGLRLCRAPPRGLVLVTVDTLRADALGAYGATGGLTPQLDARPARARVHGRLRARALHLSLDRGDPDGPPSGRARHPDESLAHPA